MQMVFECDKGWRTGRTRYVRMLCLLTYELILNCEIAIINRERVVRISFWLVVLGTAIFIILFFIIIVASH